MTVKAARLLMYRAANGNAEQRYRALKKLAVAASRGCVHADEHLGLFWQFIATMSGEGKPTFERRRR